MFVARIHNNTLGQSFLVDNWDKGVSEIVSIIIEMSWPFDENDLIRLEDTGEYNYECFSDGENNLVTLAIGEMDNE